MAWPQLGCLAHAAAAVALQCAQLGVHAAQRRLVQREFQVADDEVRIRDRLSGRACRVRFTLPLAPGLEPRLERDPQGAPLARLDLLDGALLELVLPRQLSFHVEPCAYFPRFGSQQERLRLVAEAHLGEAVLDLRVRRV